MASYKLLVVSNPVEGKDAEFNKWYWEQHVSDVLKVPGLVSAQCFAVTGPVIPEGGFPWSYAVVYDVETDDLVATLKELSGRAGTTAMPMSDAFDFASMAAAPLVSIG